MLRQEMESCPIIIQACAQQQRQQQLKGRHLMNAGGRLETNLYAVINGGQDSS